jgi:protein phosphatase
MTSTTERGIDRRHLTGPFDIVGDVHGCANELVELLHQLGHRVSFSAKKGRRHAVVDSDTSRRIVFVGDFVDRGPASPDVLRIVMALSAHGRALAVPGNHDDKFRRWLEGRDVKISHGLEQTVEQMANEDASFRDEARAFLLDLPHHLILDGGNLVVAHAGILEHMIGDNSGRTRSFCLYGDTDGTKAEDGLSRRYHWAANYRGAPAVVYGHTPVPETGWVNNTLCVDTGCCFGGGLTALRWPERTTLTVPAREVHARALRPFGHPPVRPLAAAPRSEP